MAFSRHNKSHLPFTSFLTKLLPLYSHYTYAHKNAKSQQTSILVPCLIPDWSFISLKFCAQICYFVMWNP